MPKTKGTLDRSEITDGTPLRLDQAAAIFFHEGSGITAKSLRLEHRRGRLQVFTIAGKQFTTLAYLRQMLEACEVKPKTGGSSSQPAATPPVASPAPPDGSSVMAPKCSPQDAARATLQALIKPSPIAAGPRGNRKKGSIGGLA